MIELKSKRSMNKKILINNFQPSKKNKEFYNQREKKIKQKKIRQKNNPTMHWLILFFKIFIKTLLLAYTKKIYILINFSMP